MFQFTFGLPLYVFGYSIILLVTIPFINFIRYEGRKCKLEYEEEENEGGEKEVESSKKK